MNPDPKFFCELSDECNVKSEKRCKICLKDHIAFEKFYLEEGKTHFF